MRVLAEAMLVSVDGATSFNSDAVSVEHLVVAAIQAQWTDTLAGVLQVQASCDVGTPTNWNDVTDKLLTAAGSASSGIIHLTDMGYRWLRLKYTADETPGTGTVSARVFGKGG